MHQYVYDSETATDVLFVCADCKSPLGFNKPGVGTPSAVPILAPGLGPAWRVPADAEKYMGSCTGQKALKAQAAVDAMWADPVAAIDPILP